MIVLRLRAMVANETNTLVQIVTMRDRRPTFAEGTKILAGIEAEPGCITPGADWLAAKCCEMCLGRILNQK